MGGLLQQQGRALADGEGSCTRGRVRGSVAAAVAAARQQPAQPPLPPLPCATGRTSSIGQHTLCLDSRGAILNDSAFRTQSIADYVAQASKVG